MVNKKILLGLTTTRGSDWREKIKEIDKFNIKEIALFPTTLEPDERKEMYALLEKTGLEKIIHVHLREQSMPLEELDCLVERYGTKVFNIHSLDQEGLSYDYSKYKDIIYIENNYGVPKEEDIQKFAGLCIDFSHLEEHTRFKSPAYDNFQSLMDKYKIGVGHISAIRKNPEPSHFRQGVMAYSAHYLNDLSEMDYIKKYKKYLPEFLSIELENPFEQQLKVKGYLEKIING